MTEANLRRRQKQGPKVLFRVDGGRIWGISLGHVFRCMALAGELQKQYQADVNFLMKDYEDGVHVVKSRGFDVQVIKREVEHDEEMAFIEKWGGDVVVFDLVDIAEKDIGRLSESGKRVVVNDDTGNKKLEADVVINGSIVPEFHHYLPTRKNTSYFLGPRYCVLGEAFDNIPYREIKPKVETILVSAGGSDPAGLTVKVLKALAGQPIPATINLVLGPAFAGEDAVKQAIAGSVNDFVTHRNVRDMARMMLRADLAITAGGRMAYELAATGTPGMIVPSNAIESIVASTFQREGVFVTWDRGVRDSLAEIPAFLRSLLQDLLQRTQMSARGRALLDSMGRQRAALVVGQLLE